METKETQIYNAHGSRAQIKKLAEEQFELLESLLRLGRDNEKGYFEQLDHVAEEMADCLVLMEQFRQRLGISKEQIKAIYDAKVDRELERINNNIVVSYKNRKGDIIYQKEQIQQNENH